MTEQTWKMLQGICKGVSDAMFETSSVISLPKETHRQYEGLYKEFGWFGDRYDAGKVGNGNGGTGSATWFRSWKSRVMNKLSDMIDVVSSLDAAE